MAANSLSDAELMEVVTAYREADCNKSLAADALGLNRNTFRHRFKLAETRGLLEKKTPEQEWSAEPVPDPDQPIEEILAHALQRADRLEAHKEAVKRHKITIHVDGPFGILLFGDRHMDSPGCNLRLLMRHMELVKETDGLFAMDIGDGLDAWIGRLQRLYAASEITARNAWRLNEWFFESLHPHMIAAVLGNHDMWLMGDNMGVHPIEFIEKRLHSFKAQPYEFRCVLHTPSGETFNVHLRHDFPGHSMWNPAHGPARAAQMGYGDDDLLAAGHIHSGAYMKLVNVDERVNHAVRLSAYKRYDDHATAKGFRPQNLWEGAVAIFDPYAEDRRDRVLVLGVEQGVRILRMMRGDWAAHAENAA